MNFKTKFEVDEEVWYMKDSIPTYGTIKLIICLKSAIIPDKIISGVTYRIFEDGEAFLPPEEKEKVLLNNYLDSLIPEHKVAKTRKELLKQIEK